ncbi:adenylate/guanylate cyclase domain-containing response regulator [bacterium]|nr:adenylate/guanylate cyclase domain-containing response regulator [bacterium]
MNSSASEKTQTVTPEKFRSTFRHDLRSIFSVLIGFGEVLREDLAQAQNSHLAQFELVLNDARMLLDDTAQMINHCSLASILIFQTEVKAGLRSQTLASLRTLNEKLARLESLIGQQELLTNMIEAVRQLTLRCHSPFDQRIELKPQLQSFQVGAIPGDASTEGKQAQHVMVIDDEPHNLHLIGTFLSRLGLAVTTFTSGQNALRALESESYNLILLDLHMPAMSGLDFLKTVKANPATSEIPVLVVTASDDADELAECIEAGAIDSLPKPFQSAFLKARVLTSLELQATKRREKEFAEELKFQKNRVEELLSVILPKDIIDELQATGEVKPKRHEGVCVLFCDIVNFTESCDTQDPVTILKFLQSLFSEFEAIADLHGLQKIKTIGDSFMAVAGLTPDDSLPELKATRAGLDMISSAAHHSSGWKVRVGIHSGPVVGGLVGTKQFLFDVWGDTVNTAARIEGAGQPQTLTASKTTFERLASHITGKSLGKVKLKGKGEQEVYIIESLAQN